MALTLKILFASLPQGGGYVLEPEIGKHENVVVLDFKSLYPTIMRTFRIDPYGHLMADENHHSTQTPSGHRFSKNEYILPEILENLMGRRDMAKRGAALFCAIKILMNSFYVLGSPGCRLSCRFTGRDHRTGQWILKKTISFVENRGHEVLYGDTDSIFVKLNNSTPDWDVSIRLDLAKKVNEFFTEFFQREYQVNSVLGAWSTRSNFKFLFPPPSTVGCVPEQRAKKSLRGDSSSRRTGEEGMSFSGHGVCCSFSTWDQSSLGFSKETFFKNGLQERVWKTLS